MQAVDTLTEYSHVVLTGSHKSDKAKCMLGVFMQILRTDCDRCLFDTDYHDQKYGCPEANQRLTFKHNCAWSLDNACVLSRDRHHSSVYTAEPIWQMRSSAAANA